MSKSNGKRDIPKRTLDLPPEQGTLPQWPLPPATTPEDDYQFLEQLVSPDLGATAQSLTPSELPHYHGSSMRPLLTAEPKDGHLILLDRLVALEKRVTEGQEEISALRQRTGKLESWAKQVGEIVNKINKDLQDKTDASQKMDCQLINLTGVVDKMTHGRKGAALSVEGHEQLAAPKTANKRKRESQDNTPESTINSSKAKKLSEGRGGSNHRK